MPSRDMIGYVKFGSKLLIGGVSICELDMYQNLKICLVIMIILLS